MDYVTYDQFRRHIHDGIETDKLPASSIRSSSTGPLITFSTNFDDMGRYSDAVAGSGSNTINAANGGLFISTGSTAGSYAQTIWRITNTALINLLARNPTITLIFTPRQVDTGSGEGDFYCGLGTPTVSGTTGITFTDNHVGFKLLKRSGVLTLYGTQADGAIEQETPLTTVDQGDALELRAVISVTEVTYYYAKNADDWSAGTTLTGNLPTNLLNFSFATSNRNTAQNYNLTVAHAGLSRS